MRKTSFSINKALLFGCAFNLSEVERQETYQRKKPDPNPGKNMRIRTPAKTEQWKRNFFRFAARHDSNLLT
jgi:hypothetical protein